MSSTCSQRENEAHIPYAIERQHWKSKEHHHFLIFDKEAQEFWYEPTDVSFFSGAKGHFKTNRDEATIFCGYCSSTLLENISNKSKRPRDHIVVLSWIERITTMTKVEIIQQEEMCDQKPFAGEQRLYNSQTKLVE